VHIQAELSQAHLILPRLSWKTDQSNPKRPRAALPKLMTREHPGESNRATGGDSGHIQS
jgi:hypothetical protein